MDEERVVKGYDPYVVKRLVGFLRPYLPVFITAVVLLFIATGAEISLPIIIQRTIDRYILEGDLAGIKLMSRRFLLILVVMLVTSFGQVYLMALIGQRVMKQLRISLFRHIIAQSSAYLNKQPVGRLVTRLTNDVETINELFISVIISLLKDLFILAGVVIALFYLDRKLAFIALIMVPPVLVLTAVFRILARKAFRQVRLQVSRLNTFLQEHLSGMSVVQVFTRENRSRKDFYQHNRKLMRAQLGEMYVFAAFRPIIELFATTATALVIFFGTGLHEQGLVTLGVLIAFINLVAKFFQPLRNISEQFTVLQSAMAGGERIFELFDSDKSIPDTGTRVEPVSRPAGIEFRNVSFGYNPDQPVIKNLSFSLSPGEHLAIVGYTGAGKTTIVNLLTRLWDIQEGTILVDGNDIRDFPLRALRRAVQPVMQDVFLFADTISANISLNKENISREDVIQAAQTVGADTFIERLSDGYDTVLHEQGSNLSTGQRQLISFARVLAHDPALIILDEATANIDSESENMIQNAMKRLQQKRSSIAIAHRLSTIREADRILVLHEGRIAESGNHRELMEGDGLYRSLYRLQFANG